MWATIASELRCLHLNPILFDFNTNPWMYAKLFMLVLLVGYSFFTRKL